MRYGAIALAVMAVLGLAVAFLSGSLTPSGTIANEVSETTGDAYVCGTSTSVNDPSVDIDSVSIRQVKGGWEVTVSMVPSMLTIFNESFSAAVEVRLGLYTGLYQIHNGNLTINGAVITTEFLIFFFAVLLPLEVDLKVDSFHQAEDGDPVNCDTAFLEDATAGKTTPTASPNRHGRTAGDAANTDRHSGTGDNHTHAYDHAFAFDHTTNRHRHAYGHAGTGHGHTTTEGTADNHTYAYGHTGTTDIHTHAYEHAGR